MPRTQVTRTCLATLIVFANCLGQSNSRIGRPAGTTPKTTVPPPPALSQRPASEILGGLPRVFEPNLGQTYPQVRLFTSQSPRTIPLSAQLDARHSQERLCNGF